MKEKIEKICRIIILVGILFPIFSFAQNTENELIGTLAVNGALRECPSKNCEIVRYYSETAEVKIIGIDDGNEWYKTITKDDYGNDLNGWMHYSLFTQDYRNNFLEITPISNGEKGIKQDRKIFALIFFKNSNFEVGSMIMFSSVALLMVVFLLRKNIGIIPRFLKRRVGLMKNKIGSFVRLYPLLLKKKNKNISRSKSDKSVLLKIKLKRKSLTVAIFIVIGIVISIVGVSYGAVYYKSSKLINEAKELAKTEKYNEAISKLNLAQASWFVEKLSINKQNIIDERVENEQLFQDKSKYEQGLNEFNKGDLQKSIDILSELSENSFYYQKSQTKIEESKRKVVEGELAGEKIVRKEAQEKAQQETIRRTQEEAARKVAEQRAMSEQLAKEQQQREAETQRRRADQEERDRVLELAKTHPLIRAIVSGELKFYIEPLPSYAVSGVSSAVEAIARDFSSWNPYGAPVRRVYNSNDADLTVFWVRDYGSHTIGEAIYRAHVKIGLGTDNCVGEWSAFDANTVKKILWHELGHSMGYGHSSNPNNVMYGETAIRFEVDQIISGVISGGWYKTIPLCSAGTYSYSFQTADPYGSFDLFVLPPGQDAYEISGGSGRYYPSCSAESVYSYSDSCTVASGAKIYIGNTSYRDAIRLSGKIIDMDYPSWPNMTWDPSVFRYDSDQLMKYWELFH